MHTIEKTTEKSIPRIRSFLEKYIETSLFLLGNMERYGIRLTEHMNSGNYYFISKNNEVKSVFCLTRRGNLLLQADESADFSDMIYASCGEEEIVLEGVVGEWKMAKSYFDYYCRQNPNFVQTSISKENLYSLKLERLNPWEKAAKTRRLHDDDYDQWSSLNKNFIREMGLTLQGTEDEMKMVFHENIKDSLIWGFFLNGQLVSTCLLNAVYKGTGQIGGVFTIPQERNKGYSGKTVKTLMIDSYQLHNIRKLVLFTDEENRAANSLYQSMGFKKTGSFGLLFGRWRQQAPFCGLPVSGK